MLRIDALKTQVEEYLQGIVDHIPLEDYCPETSLDNYRLKTINRLVRAYSLFDSDKKYKYDYYLALRDYLLIFDTSIQLDEFDSAIGSRFGIHKDPLSERLFASFSLPEYANGSFVKQAFLRGVSEPESPSRDDCDLSTDSMIYALTNYSTFKSLDQKLAVYGALNTPAGFTSLVSLPTGGGKSLITQLVAYQDDGLTIVVVPTISLAIDQVREAKKAIKSNTVEKEIFFYSSGESIHPIVEAINNKTAKLLFISPEALLNNSVFRKTIKDANANRYLKNIVIDEAHIVIDWGDNFRVDYQCLEPWRKNLMRSNPQIRTILLSATFESHTVALLRKFFCDNEKWIEVRCDALRKEPRFDLINSENEEEKRKKILTLIKLLPHPMIIYVARPEDAEEYKRMISRDGIKNIKTFTGKTSNAERIKRIEEWVNDDYEIMIATSAFGIGVNKNDIRTVLHAYIPPNPNAYYQELGRGGRDGLPSLSVMCVCNDDLNLSFSRINKRVMTTKKIIGRWFSLFENPRSVRIDNMINVDTSIKPSYGDENPFDDSVNDAHVNWNIYVLLFLRRNGFICLEEVLKQDGKYIFVITITDERLRNNNTELENAIEGIRQQEWNQYCHAFELMKKSVQNGNKECWSEMFYETYDKVSEYCAGCPNHNHLNKAGVAEFPLKTTLTRPIKTLTEKQKSLFSGATNLFVKYESGEEKRLLDVLRDERICAIVNMPFVPEPGESSGSNAIHLDFSLLRNLMIRQCYYYVSGIVAVFYNDEDNLVEQYKKVQQYLVGRPNVYVIHLYRKDEAFHSNGKGITELLDGVALNSNMICDILSGGKNVQG